MKQNHFLWEKIDVILIQLSRTLPFTQYSMACIAVIETRDRPFMRRCRNYACLEQEEDGSIVRGFLCGTHRKEKRRRFSHTALRSRLTVGGWGTFLHLNTQFRIKWIEELITSGYVVIRPEDVAKLENQTRAPAAYAYFLLLIARHVPEFDRSWAPTVWKDAVKILWKLRQSYGPVYITDADIRTLICVKGDMTAWADGLALYPEMGMVNDRPIGFRDVDFYRFFSEPTLKPRWTKIGSWAEEWVLQDTKEVDALKERMQKANSSVVRQVFASEEFYRWRAFEKKEWYGKQDCRIAPYKEELIATTWHPDRFADWCLDWEEKDDIFGRWPAGTST